MTTTATGATAHPRHHAHTGARTAQPTKPSPSRPSSSPNAAVGRSTSSWCSRTASCANALTPTQPRPAPNFRHARSNGPPNVTSEDHSMVDALVQSQLAVRPQPLGTFPLPLGYLL